MIDLALSPPLVLLWPLLVIKHISSIGIHGTHCGWQTFLEVASVWMPRVHMLLWSHKVQCSEGLTCPWSQIFALPSWVILSDIRNLPLRTVGVSFSCHGNSFTWSERLLGSSWLVWLFFRLPTPGRIQKFIFLRVVTSLGVFDTSFHTGPQRVPSSDWIDNYCYKQIFPRIDTCPSSCHNRLHKPSAYPEGPDLPFLSDHQFEGVKPNFLLA